MREIERKLKISRTSLRPYRERAESSGKSMDELLKMEDADLHAILSKEDVHRNRDTNRYEFLQANICLLYTSPSPRDTTPSRMPSSA